MTKIQDLLDQEARLSNSGTKQDLLKRLPILEELTVLRGATPPYCWGEDDCSTLMLVRCPWRFDCDNPGEIK